MSQPSSHRDMPLRVAPATGDVLDGGCCGGKSRQAHGNARTGARLGGGCCGGRDLGPMEDHEDPSPEDIERFSDVTRDCPHCGKEISDEAEKCHFCGQWVSSPQPGSRPMPIWAIIGGVAAIAALLFAFVLRGGIF